MNTYSNINSPNNNITISNSVILNNYSIQNMIISPNNESYSKGYNYDDSYFGQKRQQNYFSPMPKQSNFINDIKINNHYSITPITPNKFVNKISYFNIENSDYKLNNNYAQITPKVIQKIKVFSPEIEKHPQDSIKKIKRKNNIINIKQANFNMTLINALSQVHLKTIKNKISSIHNLSLQKAFKNPILEPRPSNNKSKKKKRFINIKTSVPSPKNSEYNGLNNILMLNLKEFEFKEQIGKGTFGNIFSVKWKKNKKYYAMKKETLFDFEDIKNRKKIFKIIKNFKKETGCKGVINLYGNLCLKKVIDDKLKVTNGNNNNSNNTAMYLYFELMEKAERDWNSEISYRSQKEMFYTEKEIINIIDQLIGTLSLLEQNHITHRDIKPQNILVFKGIYKLSDFGEIRVLERDGLIVQRVRGSELYMSPILFNGLHKNLIQVKHNTYKSDVFSLGMCLFYALSLTYSGVDSIREISDMNIIREILFKFLGKRYSSNLILFILSMLEVDEKKRDNFIELEKKFRKIIKNNYI